MKGLRYSALFGVFVVMPLFLIDDVHGDGVEYGLVFSPHGTPAVRSYSTELSSSKSEIEFVKQASIDRAYRFNDTESRETPTPTPTYTPVSTPTCAPCLATIWINDIFVDDECGECTDGDGLIDAGETVGLIVQGYSYDSCCWGPGDRSVIASTEYEHMTLIEGVETGDPSSMSFEYTFYFWVHPEAACLDEATVQFDAYVSDWMWQDEDHETRVYVLEVDDDGQGGYECDDTPCEGSPTPVDTPPEAPSAQPVSLAVLILTLTILLPGFYHKILTKKASDI